MVAMSKNEEKPEKPKNLRKKVTLKMVLEAIDRAGGRVADTIKILDINPKTFYEKFRYLPEVEEALKQYRQLGFDAVTETLFEQARSGNLKACSLYLKYSPFAKLNNWTDNQTVTIKEEKPLTDAEKEQLKKELF